VQSLREPQTGLEPTAFGHSPPVHRPLRALFVNENIGGHAAMHRYLRAALPADERIDASFLDVPAPGLGRRLVGAPVPVLGTLDVDLHPLRHQLAQSAWVRRRVRRWPEPYDVFHVYSHNAALLIPGELARTPSVVSTDCTNEQNARTLPQRRPTRWTNRALKLTRRFEQRVYGAATLVVAQSEYAERSLRQDYGVPEERLRLIRFGVTIPPAPRRVEAAPPEITFVGSSFESKGGGRLLSAHQRWLREHATLNVVTTERVPALDGVRVYDDVRPGNGKLDEILGRTAVFAFPSEIDKSSFAVLEAMAMGVPVVAARHGAIDELVEDGVSGIVVDAGDEVGFADALRRLLDDPELRRRMGDESRRRAVERFDAVETARRLVDVLEEARALHAERSS
jgi:alpha-maltose-1-phosphate synthase